jgi:GTP-binding protein HflX
MGQGKLKDILLKAVQKDVELLIFDLELTPSQAKKISDFCDLKVIDRTQLILDIFARNAKSRDGKLQVELAQLKYLKGRLSELDDNMSRLTGGISGIGGRGPGETKLEIGKRRVEEKITRLEKELTDLKRRRELNRKQRNRNDVPVVAIVDTNCDPEMADVIIPGNDDSAKAIELYAKGVADAVLAGRADNVSGLVEEIAQGEEFIEVDQAKA